jgi:acetoin utilization deacetylase AcuC-like enzyme
VPPVLLRHAASLDHDTGRGHPERPDRLRAVDLELQAARWLGWDVRDSPAAEDELLQTVHPAAYVRRICDLSAAGGGWIDGDTVVSPGTAAAARHGAGGAAELVDVLLSPGGPRVGASLHRPPGHHAEAARAMGFCFFNSVAVAARRALDHHGVEKVLVVDWDVHHGNGTQAIFEDSPEVLFCSIHESPLYPGTGRASETGVGAGAGWTVNLPVPGGSGDEVFCSLVEHVVVPLGREVRPGLVLISAGYDAHLDDPLAGCGVTDDGFAAMAASLRALADELDAPLGVVLEGGYELEALARGVRRTLEVVGADVPPPAPDLPVHPLAHAARARVARDWPALAAR